MDLHWQEQQRAFQAHVLVTDEPELALRPYRTFVGAPSPARIRAAGRMERLLVAVVAGAVLVLLLLAVGAPRELAAVAASFTGGVALMVAVSPRKPRRDPVEWTPLLAVYASSVVRGDQPVCVTRITVEEIERLGPEGFGTIVGSPRPQQTFGLFVDAHLVWPRTPPRGPIPTDPGFGAA